MANTIRAARNTFSGGLVMDLTPDNTSEKVLSSALNATFVTFNGNELSLQNDMGNGRVETARLPEGYIPVGTCEFGDIIYIVSYNPLTNKSLIGCFPSPERNISSEEIGNTGQLLAASDFLVLDEDSNATGELITSSVKKIIYNNKMHPGDKYIIYDKNNQICSQQHLTDLGNTRHIYGSFPKLYRIHVIAIEDSGKINFLDSTVRWYDNSGKDYFMIPTKEDNSNNIPDIDSYRDLLSSGYSVFQSKISGKLGLLIELEKINGFSCTYNVYTNKGEDLLPSDTNDKIYTKDCKVYWSINWNTENFNINPSHIVLTKSKWISKDLGVNGGIWFSWMYDGTKNQAIPSIRHSIADPPVAFGEGKYWYKDITRKYNPADTDMTYTNFITNDSYEKQLETFIIDVKSKPESNNPYADVELIKLNIAKIDTDNGYIGLPDEGKYYINLASIKKENNTYTAYTEDLNSSTMYTEIYPKPITDDIVNNYFNTSISKYFSSFSIPVKQVLNDIEYTPNISNLIYNYEITPAMDYGLLREYSIEGYIDFSKIGTGSIDLTYWKYYNTQNTSTLSIGFDAYVEENKGIAEVVLEFYDNQGIAAAYHIRNKESYSGTFTEFIPLNGAASSPNLTSTDSNDNPIYHLGTETTLLAENVIYKDSDNKALPLYYKDGKAYDAPDFKIETEHTANNDLYINDAGTIYSNALYLVKIIVKYCQKDALGKLDTSVNTEFKTYYRWFWTNTMYNQYYSNTNDFDTLPFLLNLDVIAVYSPSENYHYLSIQYSSPYLRSKTTNSSELYKNSAATVQIVASDNDSNKNNTKYYLQAGLSNTYNTFNLRGEADDNSGVYSGVYEAMSIDIFTDCDQYVLNVVEDPDIVHAGQSNYSEWTGIKPIVAENTEKIKIGNDLKGVLDSIRFPVNSFYSNEVGKDIWEEADGYKNLINNFQVVNFSSKQEERHEEPYAEKQLYIAYNNTAKPLNGKHYITKTLKDIYNINKYGTFEADIIHFSKYYYTNIEENLTAPCLVPLLRNIEDLETYGLAIKSKENSGENTEVNTGENTGENIPYVKFLYTFNMYDDGDGTESHLDIRKHSYASATSKPEETGAWGDDWDDSENQSVFGHSDGYFFRDKKSEWFSFKTQGFFLWGLSAAYDSKYSALCNFDPYNHSSGGGARWFHDTIGDKWETLYGSGEINNYATTDEDRRRAHSWNDSDGRQIAAIGFNPGGDKLEHYFNTMFLVEKLTGQEVQFISPYKERYPRYIGQYIATILCGIYLYSNDEALRVLKTNDIVHMDNNYTIYTKDIVYVAKIDSSYKDHNELISLHGIHFDDYIKYVKINSGVENNNDVKLNDSNVTLTLQGCIKNNPIQYKLEYITPKYDNLAFEGFTTAMVLKADGSKVPAQSANFEKDKLYWLDENGTILALSRRFSAECVQFMSDDQGELRATYNQAWGRMEFPNIYKMFKWEEEKLVLSYTDMAPSGEDKFSIHGQEEEDFTIRDMRKDEILVPLGNMMRPENIPI